MSDDPPLRRGRQRRRLGVVLCAASVALGAAAVVWASGSASGVSITELPVWVLVGEALVCVCSLAGILVLSFAEVSLVACSQPVIQRLAEGGDARAARLRRLLERKREDAVTLLVVGNNALILIVDTLCGHLTDPHLGAQSNAHTPMATLAYILLVCETIPKTYASHHADGVSLRVVNWVDPLVSSWAGRLVVGLVKAGSWPLRRALRADGLYRPSLVTGQELMSLADVAEEQQVLDPTQAQMFESIIEFEGRPVREIMVPRVDIVMMDAGSSLKDAVALIAERGKSRIVVYEGVADEVVGILYAHDVLTAYYRGDTEVRVGDLAREAYMVPETKPVDEVFRELRIRHIHLALVIDEHGGVDGLVTMEDVLEEIVGDVRDEHDGSERPVIVSNGADEWLVSALATPSDLEEECGLVLGSEDGEFQTLGGFLFTRSDSAPTAGYSVEHGGFRLEVVAMKGPRITDVRVVRLPASNGPRG